jgi:DNA polymerase-1
MALPRVYLIDSSIYIFRAWHIYDTSIIDRDGKPANAVFGFADFLYQFIRQKQPTHIACAFDASQSSSYRRELYPAYKANRDPAPEELKYQFALCREFCRAIGLAEFGSDRFEADDIIGSLAAHYREQGYAVTVVSADKDLAQLVIGPEDQWWDFARGNMLDVKGVKQHFGVYPHQIADMLALSGDKVDNIPGIPGVGYTTAARLLQKFDTMEDLLANIPQVAAMKFRGAARVQALLDSHAHILPLNKQLTTVVTDMAFEDPPDISLRGLDNPVFEQLMDKLAHGSALQQRWLKLFNLADPQ